METTQQTIQNEENTIATKTDNSEEVITKTDNIQEQDKPEIDYKDPTNYKILICIDSKDKNNIKCDTFNDFPGFDELPSEEKGDPWIPLLKEHPNSLPTENLLELHYLLRATAQVCYRITNYENPAILTDLPKVIMSMLLGEETPTTNTEKKETK